MKIIRVGKLIDGLGHAPVAGATVVVDGATIKEVITGPAGELGQAEQEFDFPNATLLPGLIDAHLHLTIDPFSYDTPKFLAAATDDDLLALGIKQAGEFLRAGVTTVRDLGARGNVGLKMRDALRANPALGCRVLAAGPVITTVKGHGYFNGVEVADDAELRAVVKRLIAEDADVIKLIATGGGVTPGSDPLQPQFNVASLRVAVELAHAAGLKVAAHAHSAAGIRNCLEAGIDTIEHCTFVTPEGVRSDLALIDRLARASVYVIPTLGPWYVLRESDDPFLGFPQFGLSPKIMCDQVLANLAAMREAGVKLATGTDAGTWQLTPTCTYDEIEGFTKAGFTAVEAIAAATGHAAKALDIAHETGSTAPGQQADLILVPGDPARDLSVLRKPALVMKGGQVAFQEPLGQP